MMLCGDIWPSNSVSNSVSAVSLNIECTCLHAHMHEVVCGKTELDSAA